MPKKRSRSGHLHDHYCKICGEYKANEKFSGRGHTAHICKVCSKLSAAEKATAMTINRLMDFPMGRLSASDKRWLENRVHDRRPEVAELAKEVYNAHFPYAEHNARKKQLLINVLVFELHDTTVYDEFGDEYPVDIRFTTNWLTNILTMTDFDADGIEQSITLGKKQMGKLLRWGIHTLEIFMWVEDYNLAPDDGFDDVPFLDILPEFRPDDWDEDDWFAADELEEVPEAEVRWCVEIEYEDEAMQEIVSYRDYLFDKPDELFFALLEYFDPEIEDFYEKYTENRSLE